MYNSDVVLVVCGVIAGCILALTIDSSTKGMYIPHHWHWSLPPLTSLLGFFILTNIIPPTNEVKALFYVFQFFACAHVVWMIILSYPYQKYMTAINTPDPKPAPAVEPELAPIPKANLGNWQTSNQVVAPVKFDMERQFAKTLLIMRDFKPNDEAVDLREDTWKRPNKFKTREAYITVRDKWEGRGILGRKSAAKNARYIVLRWDAVDLVASGNPLPH